MPKEINYSNIGAEIDPNLSAAVARQGAALGNPAGLTSDRTLAFVYGPEHQRTKQTVTFPNNSANAPSTLNPGTTCTRTLTNISAASAVYSCPAGPTGSAPLTLQGTGIGSVCRAIIGATPVYACPAGYSAQSAGCVSTATNGASLQAGNVRYFHTDHLGSVTAITDETGLVVERLAYDAWGKRRFTNGTADVNDTVVGLTTDRGYTEHEMLDELGIIHMNGRVYDPTIGRFMSADPYIQAPYDLQRKVCTTHKLIAS